MFDRVLNTPINIAAKQLRNNWWALERIETEDVHWYEMGYA